jgi:CysZ protein
LTDLLRFATVVSVSNPSAIPDLPSRSSTSDFFRGLRLPFRGFGLIFKTSKLRVLTLISAVVTVVTLGIVAWLVAAYGDDLLALVWKYPDTWMRYVWKLARFLISVLLFVVGANILPALVLAPLQDPLSEATEELCGDFQSPPFTLANLSKGLSTSVGHTVARIGILLLGQLLLFPINLLPGIGSIIWTVLASLWTIGWLATEYLDAPMARNFYRFGDVRRVVMKRLPLCMGFGTAVYVLLWVPVLNFFFIPAAVVGGTLLYRGLRASGDLTPPPPPVAR